MNLVRIFYCKVFVSVINLEHTPCLIVKYYFSIDKYKFSIFSRPLPNTCQILTQEVSFVPNSMPLNIWNIALVDRGSTILQYFLGVRRTSR